MNDEKKLDGALCADVGTADAAAAQVQPVEAPAPAEGKKKYVPPTMQVIPLGPQRMLATSGPGGSPFSVHIRVSPVDLYLSDGHIDPAERCEQLNYNLCGNTANGAWNAQTTEIYAVHADLIEEAQRIGHTIMSTALTPAYELSVFAMAAGPTATFVGVDWASQDFLDNAVIQCDGNGGYYGTYMGQPFTATLEMDMEHGVFIPYSRNFGTSDFSTWRQCTTNDF